MLSRCLSLHAAAEVVELDASGSDALLGTAVASDMSGVAFVMLREGIDRTPTMWLLVLRIVRTRDREVFVC